MKLDQQKYNVRVYICEWWKYIAQVISECIRLRFKRIRHVISRRLWNLILTPQQKSKYCNSLLWGRETEYCGSAGESTVVRAYEEPENNVEGKMT